MALSDILLRILSDATASTKGSELTWQELDTNIKELIRALEAINNGGEGGLSSYNAGTTYSKTDSGTYITYDDKIYLFVSDTPLAGVTPGSNDSVWVEKTAGDLVHALNKDDTLDEGGDNEVTADEVRHYLDNGYGQFPPALALADPESSPPTENEGDHYLLDNSTALTVSAIEWQSGNTIRYTFSGSPDLSGYAANDYIEIKNSLYSQNDGIFLISSVNDASDYIEATNTAISTADYDETTSPATTAEAGVILGEWDGAGQGYFCRFDGTFWYSYAPIEGNTCRVDPDDSTSGSDYAYENGQWVAHPLPAASIQSASEILAAGANSITFSAAFASTPKVAVTVIDSSGNSQGYKITSLTTAGFTLQATKAGILMYIAMI